MRTRVNSTNRRWMRRLLVAAMAGALGVGSTVVAMEASADEIPTLLIRTTVGINSIFVVTSLQQRGGVSECVEIPGPALHQPFGNDPIVVGTPIQVVGFDSSDCTDGRIADCRTEAASAGEVLIPLVELDVVSCRWTVL